MASLWQSRQALSRSTRPGRADAQRRHCRPQLELLEDRMAPAVYTVTALTDTGAGSGLSGDLRYCINASNGDRAADTITFAESLTQSGPATIYLNNGTLHLSNPNGISIQGPGAALLTIDGQNGVGVFTNYRNYSATLQGLTIAHGRAFDGGGIENEGTLTVNNCAFVANQAITGNYNGGDNYGGAVYNQGSLSVSNSTFTGNSATSYASGGQWYTYWNGYGYYSYFSYYYAYANGGAIYSDYSAASLQVSNCTFSGNSTSANAYNGSGYYSAGGAIFSRSNPASIVDSTISGNSTSASYNGGTGYGEAGGVEINVGTGTISNCTFSSNTASYGGGLADFTTLTVTNCTLSGNSATYLGGAIYANGNTLNLANTIAANSASGTDLYTAYALVTAQNNLIQTESGSPGIQNGVNGNIVGSNPLLSALGYYGGQTQTFALLPGSPALNAGSNSAASALTTDQRGLARISGGTVDIGAVESQPLIVNTTADGNVIPFGQLDLRQAVNLANILGDSETITFDSSVFATPQTITLGGTELPVLAQNMAITGPGVGVTVSGTGLSRVFEIGDGSHNPSVTISNLTVTDGSANGASFPASYGGGVFDRSTGTVTLWNCTLTANAAGEGGGFYSDGAAVLNGCTISDNFAQGNGGGLANDYLSMTLSNCTVAGNTDSGSGFGGGGIFNYQGTLTLTNCSVAGNSANGLPGGGVLSTGQATLNNTIVAGNSASNAESDIVNSGTLGGDYDLTGDNSAPGAHSIINANPLLAALGNYGGITETMPLLPGSPALDAGSNSAASGLSIDQRGQPRINNGTVDIGAFESRGFTVTVNSGDGQSTPINTAFANPLTVTVTSANGEPVAGGTVNFTAPASGASASFSSATVTLPSNGQASVTLTANGTGGTYAVTASAGSSYSCTASLTNASDATASTTFQRTGYAYNRSTKLFYGTLTATNAGSQTLDGDMFLVLQNLTSGVTLSTATITIGSTTYSLAIRATPESAPIITIPKALLSGLAPGSSVTVSLAFSNPAHAVIGYNPELFSNPN